MLVQVGGMLSCIVRTVNRVGSLVRIFDRGKPVQVCVDGLKVLVAREPRNFFPGHLVRVQCFARWIDAGANRLDEIGLAPFRDQLGEVGTGGRAETAGRAARKVLTVAVTATYVGDEILAIGRGGTFRRRNHRLGVRRLRTRRKMALPMNSAPSRFSPLEGVSFCGLFGVAGCERRYATIDCTSASLRLWNCADGMMMSARPLL